jgi:hypothetical protein
MEFIPCSMLMIPSFIPTLTPLIRNPTISKLQHCCHDVKEGMCSNLLKQNEEKTAQDYNIWIKNKPKKINISSLNIWDCNILPVNKVRNIGAYLD